MAWWTGGGWGRGWRGGGWGMWPGKGPFSFLPPWLRPGWLFGRGACRFLFPWMWMWYGYIPYWTYMPYYYMLLPMWYMTYMYPRWW